MEPNNCPDRKYGTDSGEIPVNVFVKIREIVTAGFANDVDEVNQYPAVINKATDEAIDSLLLSLTNNIVIIKPEVAIISLTNKGNSPLTFVEIWNILIWKI